MQHSARISRSTGPTPDSDPPSGGLVGAVVLAAGSGRRFGARKQFLELTPGTRLVDRAVATASAVAEAVVVVLPEGESWDGAPVYARATGAADRLGSVRNGLAALPDQVERVLVHDAAHALASVDLARSCIEALSEGVAAAVPWLETPDVIATAADGSLGNTLGRAGLGVVQVPIAFRVGPLTAAHRAVQGGFDMPPHVVEDAGLLRTLGHEVAAVPGEATNVHVVDPSTLEMARALAR